jgi:hypothetical protein
VTVLKDGIRRGTEEITNIDRVKLINPTLFLCPEQGRAHPD